MTEKSDKKDLKKHLNIPPKLKKKESDLHTTYKVIKKIVKKINKIGDDCLFFC